MYETLLCQRGAEPWPVSHNARHFFQPNLARNHLLGMIDQMNVFLDQGRLAKCQRWIGFMQGCLWMLGEFSLNELKEHNRPPTRKK